MFFLFYAPNYISICKRMQFFCNKLLYAPVFFALILRAAKIETRIAL